MAIHFKEVTVNCGSLKQVIPPCLQMPCNPASTHYTVPEHFILVTSLVSQNNLQFIQCFTFKEGQKSKKLSVMTLIGVICKNSDSEGNNLDSDTNYKQYWKVRYFQSYGKICDVRPLRRYLC